MKFLAAAQQLWGKFNLRGMIILSLFLQVILIFLAPIRKRRSNRLIMIITWAAYLLADWIADYAFGLIAKAQFNGGTSKDEDEAYGDLLAFWAPFLLLHLGGPDTITAFALEDNELWRRHLLNLFFQLVVAGYVFYQSLPSNKLIVPTILVFIGGLIKYIERTRALYLGSFSKFRASLLTRGDAGPNYAKLMEEHSSKEKANIPAKIEMMPEPDLESPVDGEKTSLDNNDGIKSTDIKDKEVIKAAFFYFTTFRGLLVDLIFSFRERNESMKFFKDKTAKDAFRVIEAELNFFYEVLYTKAAVVHCPTGYFFRAISIGCVITAFALFYVLNKQQSFHEYDIKITYTLLLGAVGLEFVALSMLICSDWTIALLGRSEKDSSIKTIKRTFIEFLLKFKSEDSSFALHMLHARWSKSIFQYNLIDSRLRRWPIWIEKLLDLIPRWPKWIVKLFDFISLQELFDDLKSGRAKQYKEELGELIFRELQNKSSDAKDSESIKEKCAARGKWALGQRKEGRPDCKALLPFVQDVDYGESLLLWHIATELRYNIDINPSTDGPWQNSRILSDYMLHLMIKQPNMMSTVAGIGEIRFRDTCAEMDKFISDISEGSQEKKITKKIACQRLLDVPTKVKPVHVKGDRSKSALFDACILAKELDKLREAKWDIINEVWVELLGYAAIHCRPYNHAQQLSKGGELVTLVWLLMVHLGLSEQFQIVEGHARAKLIVQK